ncbi:MAG TPA: hypothetical protein VHS59_00490 [Bacillota bacterium]|nr:hypothetical protein [Bacillota bacterium]
MSAKQKEGGKTVFQITEYPGNNTLLSVLLDPLVDYINNRAGRVVVKIGQTPREPGKGSHLRQDIPDRR